MNRQLRRITSVALSLTLAIPVAAQSQESPFPVSTGLYGAVVPPQAAGGNYYGRFPASGGASSCTTTRYNGPAINGQGAVVLLPILLVAIPVVAITTAINNEICKRG